jgi:hypothetical protein
MSRLSIKSKKDDGSIIKQTNKQNVKQNVNVKVHVGDIKKKRKYKRKANKKSEPKDGVSSFQNSYIQPYHPVFIQSGNPYNYEANNQKPVVDNPLLKAIEELTNNIQVNYRQPQRVNSLLASAYPSIGGDVDSTAYDSQRDASLVDDNLTLSSENISDDSDFSITPIDRLRTLRSNYRTYTDQSDQPFSNPKRDEVGLSIPSSYFDYTRENPLLENVKQAGGGVGFGNPWVEQNLESENQELRASGTSSGFQNVENEVFPLDNTVVARRRGRPPVAKSKQQLEEERLAKNERARMRRQAAKMKYDEQKLWESKKK